MKKNFKRKEIFYVLLLTLAVITPFIPRYHRLDLQLKFKYVIIPWICLIFALLAIIWLIDTVREEDKDKEKEDKESNWTNNKFEISEDNFNNCYEDVSMDNKIALIQRLRELKNWKFEEVVEMLFKFKWYKIEKWPNYYWDLPQVDWWKDLIMLKDNKIYNVQIKKYYTDPVKLTDIKCFKCDIWEESWFFVTTSIFSPKAKKLANEKWINCVEYNDLLCVISKLPDKDKKIIQNFINDENNIDKGAHPKTCKKCWAPINDRNWWYCLRNRYPRPNEKQCTCREFYK